MARAVEAWFIADREALAAFLDVPATLVPGEPESLPRPKRAVVDLAARSSRPAIRRSVVPREGSGREVGGGDSAAMVEFGRRHWTVERALQGGRCPSLERAQVRLSQVTSDRGP